MRRAALVSAALLLPACLGAQMIRGVVVDAASGDPVAGATVEALAPDSTPVGTVTTGSNGWFTLAPKRTGRLLLRTSHPSWTGGVEEVSVRKGEFVTVLLRMGRAAIPLEPLLVTARAHSRAAPFHQRAAHGGQGRYIMREDIDKRLLNRPSDMLRTVPEIILEPARGSPSQEIVMVSLGERCNPAIFLDGWLVPQVMGFDVDDLITSDEIEGIEIYRNYITAPPELLAQALQAMSEDRRVDEAACGLVAFWSRSPGGRALTWKRAALGAAVGAAILLLR